MKKIDTREPSAEFAKNANLDREQYESLYRESISNPEVFWARQAERFVTWVAPWREVLSGSFSGEPPRWFTGGRLNVCYNCVDRHLASRGDKVALVWEGDAPGDILRMTWRQLHQRICQLANFLKASGIRKGDRVSLYLPMIPEMVIAMLACARIGAVHSVVFGGFSSHALAARLQDADSRLLITADEGLRGGKRIPLKKNADTALLDCPAIEKVIVVRRTGEPVPMTAGRDLWYHEALEGAPDDCPPEPMEATDPLFILYTSGSTGKPKGVLHATGGYLVHVASSFHYVFDHHEGDIFWCTADAGWITGHSYLVYGPLANAATILVYEGVPTWPTVARFWEMIDRHGVTTFYTAPTAIRALRREGDAWVRQSHRKSLRLLGTVGEPINPDVWEWYYHVVGEGRCPVVDTWWQTETGGIAVVSLPAVYPQKPGSAGQPFFGIVPEVVDEEGNVIQDETPGRLVIRDAWPGLMHSVHGDPVRYFENYFRDVPGKYLTGDGAWRDRDGYFWITGRNDDVIKVSGHRIGTGEVESALITHPAVAEAGVVAVPDDIKGQVIHAWVVLREGGVPSDALKKALIQRVREEIGPIATPEVIHWAPALPKTRSGKIMRRILRKIACCEFENLGDTSTLADPEVVGKLIEGYR